MTKTPDPSYWGNPPRTPRSHHDPTQQQGYGAPPSPYQQAPFQQQPSQQAPCQQAGQSQPQPQPQPQQPGSNPNFATQPQPPKKRHTGCIVAAIIAIVLFLALCVGGCMALQSLIDSTNGPDLKTSQLPAAPSAPESPSAPQSPADPATAANNEFLRTLFGLPGDAALSTEELDDIQRGIAPDSTKKPNDQGEYDQGVYYIGSDIPQGSYWFDGSNTQLSYFFILEPSQTTEGSYDVTLSNSYYGHNIMDVKDGEVLVLANGSTLMPLESFDGNYSAPYSSGMYRVGTDIPAGTYQLKLGPANDYSACFVMRDLDYTDESYLSESHYIPGDVPEEITLEEGTYVELYNMSMTSLTV